MTGTGSAVLRNQLKAKESCDKSVVNHVMAISLCELWLIRMYFLESIGGH